MAHDNIKVLFGTENIAQMIKEMSHNIYSLLNLGDYEDVVFIGILKGGLNTMFMLLKCPGMESIFQDCQYGFIGVASYGCGIHPETSPMVTYPLDVEVRGKTVILVDDISDTGNTLEFVKKILKGYNPERLITVTLLDKKCVREHTSNPQPDVVGAEVGDVFVVGCGMGDGEMYRGLQYIGYDVELERAKTDA